MKDFKVEKHKSAGISTCGFFIVSNNHLLLVHPTRSRDLSIPKGQVDNDENYLETAIRELKEETGIDVDDLHILELKQFPSVIYKNKRKTLHPFLLITDTYLDPKKMECTTFVKDSEWNDIYPENDKFYILNLFSEESVSFFERLHDSQKEVLNMILKYLS